MFSCTKKDIDLLLAKYGIGYPPCGFSIGPGWLPFVESAFDEMIAAGWDRKLGQVKQKFCSLCIYIDGETNSGIESAISKAVKACNIVCENCGKPHGLDIPRCGRALCKTCEALR